VLFIVFYMKTSSGVHSLFHICHVRLSCREWRKLHNEELRDLYSLPSIIRIIKSRRMRWASHVARMGEKRNAYRLLVGKPQGKKPLGRTRRRWLNNIRMDLGEVGWVDVDWIGLAQDRNRWRVLVNSVLNLRVPRNAGKLSSGLTSSGLSSSAQLHTVSLLANLVQYYYWFSCRCFFLISLLDVMSMS
jgi:hypothetical protein